MLLRFPATIFGHIIEAQYSKHEAGIIVSSAREAVYLQAFTDPGDLGNHGLQSCKSNIQVEA